MKHTTNILRVLFFLIGTLMNYGFFFYLQDFSVGEDGRGSWGYDYLGIYAVYIALMLSPWGDKWLNLSIGTRVPTRAEEKRLQALYDALVGRNSDLPKRTDIRVMTDLSPNAMAFGKNTVALTTGLLKSMGDEEVQAVLAHELGHIAQKDTLGDLITYMAYGPLIWVGYIVAQIAAWIAMLGQRGGLLSLFIFVLGLPAIAAIYIYLFFLWLKQFTSRAQEFAADAYAMKATGHDGLIRFLEQIEHLDATPQGKFLASYMASHPPSAVRIDRAEQIMEQLK